MSVHLQVDFVQPCYVACFICVHAGEVLMLTTPEAPQNVLSKIRTRTSRIQGILHGYYRVTGDQVSGQACLGARVSG